MDQVFFVGICLLLYFAVGQQKMQHCHTAAYHLDQSSYYYYLYFYLNSSNHVEVEVDVGVEESGGEVEVEVGLPPLHLSHYHYQT